MFTALVKLISPEGVPNEEPVDLMYAQEFVETNPGWTWEHLPDGEGMVPVAPTDD